MAETFTVKTESFEGPLDLLLSLVEKRKLHINDVSLARVTDDFISYIESRETFPLSQAAHFIYIASTLLLVKSKSLLPTLDLSTEEEESVEDLEKRLKLYRLFRDAAKPLRERFGRYPLFTRPPTRLTEPVFSPDPGLSATTVHAAAQRVLAALPKHERVPETTVREVISLDEMITRLTERVQQHLEMRFSEFSKADTAEKVDVIVGFLAMLELVKRGIITVRQEAKYGDITMQSRTVGMPQYRSAGE